MISSVLNFFPKIFLSLIYDGEHKFSINYFLPIVSTLSLVYFWSDIKSYWNDRAKRIKVANSLSGPPTFPIVGNALEFAADLDSSIDTIVKLAAPHKPACRFWMGPELFIVIFSPKDIETVLTSPKAVNKGKVYQLMSPAATDSLINASGAKYRHLRKTVMPIINGKALFSSFIHSFNHHSKIFVKTLESKVDKGEFNFGPEVQYCVLDIVHETLLGVEGTSQIDKNKNLVIWNEKFLYNLHARMVRKWMHIDFIFYLSNTGKRYIKYMTKLHNYYDKLIKDKKVIHEACKNNEKTAEEPKVSILDLMLKSGALSDFEIKMNLMPLFIGFFDTIDGVMSFMILLLAIFKDKQEILRKEINDIVGPDEDITEDHVSQLKYAEMVIKEALRLFPAGPIMVREVSDDLELETFTLPKGSSVVMLPIITFRSPDLWEDPDKFIPERFSSDNPADIHPFAFFPFSAGLRSCPGYKCGLVCLKVVLVHLLRNYEFSSTTKLEDVEIKTDVTLKSRKGYNVSIKKVNSSI